jgi:hypothetical protein
MGLQGNWAPVLVSVVLSGCGDAAMPAPVTAEPTFLARAEGPSPSIPEGPFGFAESAGEALRTPGEIACRDKFYVQDSLCSLAAGEVCCSQGSHGANCSGSGCAAASTVLACDGPEDCGGHACCTDDSFFHVACSAATDCPRPYLPRLCHSGADCPTATPMCCPGSVDRVLINWCQPESADGKCP